jgi:hypothetical protein
MNQEHLVLTNKQLEEELAALHTSLQQMEAEKSALQVGLQAVLHLFYLHHIQAKSVAFTRCYNNVHHSGYKIMDGRLWTFVCVSWD